MPSGAILVVIKFTEEKIVETKDSLLPYDAITGSTYRDIGLGLYIVHEHVMLLKSTTIVVK